MARRCGSARPRRSSARSWARASPTSSAERELQSALLARVLPRARDVRRAGSAALDLAWVAAGRLDVFYEHGLSEWDHAAGDVLVREAGGVVVPLPAAGGLRAGILAGPEALTEALFPLVQG